VSLIEGGGPLILFGIREMGRGGGGEEVGGRGEIGSWIIEKGRKEAI